jgi:hypothetical protein
MLFISFEFSNEWDSIIKFQIFRTHFSEAKVTGMISALSQKTTKPYMQGKAYEISWVH